MKRTFTTAAVAITSALAFGATAPAAYAAPEDKPTHARTDKGAKSHAGTGRAEQSKAAAASRRVAAQQRATLRVIAVTDTGLARVAASPRTAALATEVADAVVANITLDRDALAELKAAAEAADSTLVLHQVRRDLRAFQVANYLQAVTVAHGAAHALEQVADNDAALAELAAGTDVTEAQADNAAAGEAASAALEAALTVTATSGKDVLAGARTELTTARELLESVEAFLAGHEAEGPVDEAPAV